jgi:hypothetical protein
MRTKTIYCQFRFEGWHRWPTPIESEAYLGVRHRHLFHVKVWFPVTDSDREIEFIQAGRRLRVECEKLVATGVPEEWSCEHWCDFFMKYSLDGAVPVRVQVSEDGENGAEIWA